MKHIIYYICFFALSLVVACTGKEKHDDANGADITMHYAKLLTMQENDGYITVSIVNPWDTTHILHKYILMKEGSTYKGKLPAGDVVRIPLRSAAVYTSVHCGLIDELGAYGCIKGVCDLQYINMKKVHDDVASGKIADLGESMTPNVEAIINLQPGAIFLSPFENSGSYGKTGKIGIPIIECADYMETSPLGRAEWMKFYGLLLGKEKEADSLFKEVERRYNNIKTQAQKAKTHPTVVTEMKIGSTWYVAGGESTVGILINDAGGNYVFRETKARGALPYSPEMVFEKAKDADYWLIKYNQSTDMTLSDLQGQWGLNEKMKAFHTKQTYGCNLSLTHFYEETPFHPDILLKEYADILHGKGNGKYYKRIDR